MDKGKRAPDGDLTDDPTLNLDFGWKSQLGALDLYWVFMVGGSRFSSFYPALCRLGWLVNLEVFGTIAYLFSRRTFGVLGICHWFWSLLLNDAGKLSTVHVPASKIDMVAARYDDDYDDDDDDDDDDHVHVHVHVHLGPLFLFRMRDPEAACCGDTWWRRIWRTELFEDQGLGQIDVSAPGWWWCKHGRCISILPIRSREDRCGHAAQGKPYGDAGFAADDELTWRGILGGLNPVHFWPVGGATFAFNEEWGNQAGS